MILEVDNGCINEEVQKALNSFEESSTKTIKISIDEETYRKIKSFGVLIGLDGKEPIFFGNTISKLYDIAKEKIYSDYVWNLSGSVKWH